MLDVAARRAQLERVTARLLRVPLGAARGGSGATELEVVLVEVIDVDGAVGTGFTYSLEGGGAVLVALIEQFVAPGALTGDLPWLRTRDALWRRSHRLGHGFAVAAISALDIAVWDLWARRAGVPLHAFLGADDREIPIYGSGRATHSMTTAELVDATRSYVDEGYRAVKIRAGALGIAVDVERVRAVREAVGPGVMLMVDCNERLDRQSSLWLGSRLRDLGVAWIEEPLPSHDVRGHAQLAARLDLPIAVGEHLHSRFEFVGYIDAAAADVLQPDAPLVGGVTEWMRVADLAESHGLAISPHFLPELHIHLALATPAATMIEHFPLLDDLLADTLAIADGRATAPARPGHGIVWDDGALKRFAA
jgi:L-alanine-DL-glutamate epimerase-like enolase superfamily enzyme